MKKCFLFLVVLAVFACRVSFGQAGKIKPVIIGYVAGYNGIIDETKIDAAKLTHINYAFVNLLNNRAVLDMPGSDTVNFGKLNALKQRNPGLKILISIGGWTWSKNFSDAVLTDTGRAAFASSAVNIIRSYKLDGVDIDWEYPNMRGDGNVFRPEDKQHYTLLFRELRHELDALEKERGQHLLLTTAVGGFPAFVANTEMHEAQTYLDYVNLMTYDFSWGQAGHHTGLYHAADYNQENSANKAVQVFVQAGVPASKLVMGIAFYGRGGIVGDTVNRGYGQKLLKPISAGGFSYIKDSLVNKRGYMAYWDEKAMAPYLFNPNKKHFVSYDDERSVTEKCLYVMKQQMGGVMFWEYADDPKGYLLEAMRRTLYAR